MQLHEFPDVQGVGRGRSRRELSAPFCTHCAMAVAKVSRNCGREAWLQGQFAEFEASGKSQGPFGDERRPSLASLRNWLNTERNSRDSAVPNFVAAQWRPSCRSPPPPGRAPALVAHFGALAMLPTVHSSGLCCIRWGFQRCRGDEHELRSLLPRRNQLARLPPALACCAPARRSTASTRTRAHRFWTNCPRNIRWRSRRKLAGSA